MDGMLSQDEISALLNGMDLSAEVDPSKIGDSEEVTEVPSSMPSETGIEEQVVDEDLLSDVEKEFEHVQKVTHCSTGCGSCHSKILDILSEYISG